MKQAQVVLRQVAVDEVAALPSRARAAPPPAIDTLALALQEGREEGLRQGRERGLQSGYEEGLREGRAAAKREAEECATRLEEEAAVLRNARRAETQAALAAFQEASARWLKLAEADMVALCFEALARVLGDRASREDQLRAQVTHLLAQWHEEGTPALHVHPTDVELLEGLPALRPFTCVADPAVNCGGCMVKGSSGALDARLDRILEQVKAALVAVHKSEDPA